ncbi:hypothetical protein DM02DRAFT_105711 [Periconia macrospinosa]|uniref:Transmembrane protein n=1 Tax=Periconia macrospinosa TaxID=97972 RepID=A0A2V1DF13_9PLEO|nr:hypothetical protein DM02DRAFT_105711 [Periconia macrospinosa]
MELQHQPQFDDEGAYLGRDASMLNAECGRPVKSAPSLFYVLGFCLGLRFQLYLCLSRYLSPPFRITAICFRVCFPSLCIRDFSNVAMQIHLYMYVYGYVLHICVATRLFSQF